MAKSEQTIQEFVDAILKENPDITFAELAGMVSTEIAKYLARRPWPHPPKKPGRKEKKKPPTKNKPPK